MRKQYSNCYGRHVRKNCNSERVSFETFDDHFRINYDIPEEFFGRFAKTKLQGSDAPTVDQTPITDQVSGSGSGATSISANKNRVRPAQQVQSLTPTQRLKITLRKSEGDV